MQTGEMKAVHAQLVEAQQATQSVTEQLVAEQQALREALAANQALVDASIASQTAAAQVTCPSGVLPFSVKTMSVAGLVASILQVCSKVMRCCCSCVSDVVSTFA